ncbi:MAG TPA: TIGR03435 family protein [Acidobacteriaceae bacterium]
MKKMPLLCAAILSVCATFPYAAVAQAVPSQNPKFDVATIKPAGDRPSHGWVGMQAHPDAVEVAFQTLPEILCVAYGYNIRFDGQISGVPAWATTQKYDITAKMSAEDAADLQKLSKGEQEKRRQAMMQSLLADRFHLALHKGSKDIPVYELVVAKGGIKIKDAATDPDPSLKRGDDGKPVTSLRWQPKTTILQAYSMKSLADILSIPAASVGRPVIDKTGLTGSYDFTFDWSIYSAAAAAAPADSPDAGSVPSVFTAVGELGLKLQSATVGAETIVIDHAERPVEN